VGGRESGKREAPGRGEAPGREGSSKELTHALARNALLISSTLAPALTPRTRCGGALCGTPSMSLLPSSSSPWDALAATHRLPLRPRDCRVPVPIGEPPVPLAAVSLLPGGERESPQGGISTVSHALPAPLSSLGLSVSL